jgi:hypothetical protein
MASLQRQDANSFVQAVVKCDPHPVPAAGTLHAVQIDNGSFWHLVGVDATIAIEPPLDGSGAPSTLPACLQLPNGGLHETVQLGPLSSGTGHKATWSLVRNPASSRRAEDVNTVVHFAVRNPLTTNPTLTCSYYVGSPANTLLYTATLI